MVSPSFTSRMSNLIAKLAIRFHLDAVTLAETKDFETWLVQAFATVPGTFDFQMFEDLNWPERNAHTALTRGT